MRRSFIELVVALLVLGVFVIALFPRTTNGSATSTSNVVYEPQLPPWLTSSANTVTAAQLESAYSSYHESINLPTWLPTGYSLTSIHVPDPNNASSFAIISYSNSGATSPLSAEIVIQAEPSPGGQTSPSDLAQAVSNSNGSFVQISVAGTPVLLNSQAENGDPSLQQQFGNTIYANFWYNGMYFQIDAHRPLTTQDVTDIISSMLSGH